MAIEMNEFQGESMYLWLALIAVANELRERKFSQPKITDSTLKEKIVIMTETQCTAAMIIDE